MSKIAIALFGSSEVEGYSAPVGTHWRFSIAGGDSLDLRSADLPRDHTARFVLAKLFGGCKIRVPKGTKVDLGGFVLVGGNSSKVQPGNGETNNSISIRFYALAGGVSVESD